MPLSAILLGQLHSDYNNSGLQMENIIQTSCTVLLLRRSVREQPQGHEDVN